MCDVYNKIDTEPLRHICGIIIQIAISIVHSLSFSMIRTKCSLVVVVVVAILIARANCQVSFSTSWGSGKRSQAPAFSPPTNDALSRLLRTMSDEPSQCFSRLQYNILNKMSEVLKAELEQAEKCVAESKQLQYE